MDDSARIINLAGIHTGMVGNNCHVMNIMSALFIACGQDVAQTIHASSAISTGKRLDNGDFNFSISIPNLLIGTVGGGTNLKTQNECLQLLGCTGDNSILKFAEIVAATLLAGEVGISLAVAGGTFVSAHENLGRNRPEGS